MFRELGTERAKPAAVPSGIPISSYGGIGIFMYTRTRIRRQMLGAGDSGPPAKEDSRRSTSSAYTDKREKEGQWSLN